MIMREIDGVATYYFVRKSESQDIEDYLDNSPLSLKDAINSIYDGGERLSLKGTISIIFIIVLHIWHLYGVHCLH